MTAIEFSTKYIRWKVLCKLEIYDMCCIMNKMSCLFAIMLYNSSWSIDSTYVLGINASKLNSYARVHKMDWHHKTFSINIL